MALYLPNQKVLFLHIPKCGGFWVEETLFRAGVAVHMLAHPEDKLRADRHANVTELGVKPELTCLFVRHPIKWFESWWKYSAGRPHNWDEWQWHPTYPLQKCQAVDFNVFIDKVLAMESGVLTRIYRHYLGDFADSPDIMVGRVEHMAEDMLAMLQAVGITVSPEVVCGVPPQNTSSSIFGLPHWHEWQRHQIIEAEKPIIEKWYSGD